jgi:hypothetical protein
MDLKTNHKWIRIQIPLEYHAKLKSFCALAGKTQEDFINQLLLDYETNQNKGNK